MNPSRLGRGTVVLWSHWDMVTHPILSLCALPPPFCVSSFHVECANWNLLVPASSSVVPSIDSRSPSGHWDERTWGLTTQPCSFQKVTHEPRLSFLIWCLCQGTSSTNCGNLRPHLYLNAHLKWSHWLNLADIFKLELSLLHIYSLPCHISLLYLFFLTSSSLGIFSYFKRLSYI